MEQLDAALAAWRSATAPLDAKASTFLLPSASSSRSSGAVGAATRARGSCRPWSHADFGARVASFAIATWFAKPVAVSALACARHGWHHSGRPDELRCDSCKQFLCFEIDATLSEEGVQRVASTFAEMLTSGHSPLCPWRENPSPEAFAALPIASLEQVRESLVKRVERALAACASDTALMRALGALRLDAGALESILEPPDSSSAASPDPDSVAAAAALPEETQEAATATRVLESALMRKFEDFVVLDDKSVSLSVLLLHVAILSACGWELGIEEGESARVARCEICCRRWSVSSYSAASTPSDSEADADRASKRLKVTHATALDPVAQHRWFCPWVTARKQEASRDLGGVSTDDDVAKYGENDARLWEFTLLPGWKQFAKALRTLNDAGAGGSAQDESGKKCSQPTQPERALESVRAVLGLPEW